MTGMEPPTPVPAGTAHPRAVPAVWLATVLFSTGGVMVAAAQVSGPVLSFWRMWAGVPMFIAVAWWRRGRTGRAAERSGWRLAAVAGLAFAAHQVSNMSALRMTSVVDVTLMNTICPVVVGVAAVPLFGERPARSFRLWSGLAMVGAAGVALQGSVGPQGNPAGMVLAAANVVFYSVYFVLSKRALASMDGWSFLAAAFTTGAATVSAFVLVSGADVRAIGGHDLLLAVAIAVVPGLAGHGCMTWALRHVPANVPPVVMLSMPVFAGGSAWLILGQPINAGTVAAGAVTVAGVLGAMRSPIGTDAQLDLEFALVGGEQV